MSESSAVLQTRPVVHLARPAIPDAQKMMTTPLDIWLHALEPYLTPATQAAAHAQFGAWMGNPAHPALVINEFSDFICQAGFPDRTRADARRRMAHLSVAKYQQSILGRVMLAPLASWDSTGCCSRSPSSSPQ